MEQKKTKTQVLKESILGLQKMRCEIVEGNKNPVPDEDVLSDDGSLCLNEETTERQPVLPTVIRFKEPSPELFVAMMVSKIPRVQVVAALKNMGDVSKLVPKVMGLKYKVDLQSVKDAEIALQEEKERVAKIAREAEIERAVLARQKEAAVQFPTTLKRPKLPVKSGSGSKLMGTTTGSAVEQQQSPTIREQYEAEIQKLAAVAETFHNKLFIVKSMGSDTRLEKVNGGTLTGTPPILSSLPPQTTQRIRPVSSQMSLISQGSSSKAQSTNWSRQTSADLEEMDRQKVGHGNTPFRFGLRTLFGNGGSQLQHNNNNNQAALQSSPRDYGSGPGRSGGSLGVLPPPPQHVYLDYPCTCGDTSGTRTTATMSSTQCSSPRGGESGSGSGGGGGGLGIVACFSGVAKLRRGSGASQFLPLDHDDDDFDLNSTGAGGASNSNNQMNKQYTCPALTAAFLDGLIGQDAVAEYGGEGPARGSGSSLPMGGTAESEMNEVLKNLNRIYLTPADPNESGSGAPFPIVDPDTGDSFWAVATPWERDQVLAGKGKTISLLTNKGFQ